METLPSIVVTEDVTPPLDEYAAIPSRLLVREILEPEPCHSAASGFELVPRPLREPFVKDYDNAPCLPPQSWPTRFDIRTWGFLTAQSAGAAVGRAAVAWPWAESDNTHAGVAVLWDIRVAPTVLRRGVGTMLLKAAEVWATRQGASVLDVETQNVNAPACRFYAKQGFVLRSVDPIAYPDLPGECQLLWRKVLA